VAEDIFGEAYKIERAFSLRERLVKGRREFVYRLLRNAYSEGFGYSGLEGLTGYDLLEYLRQTGESGSFWVDYFKLGPQEVFRILEYLVKKGKVGKYRDGSYYPYWSI